MTHLIEKQQSIRKREATERISKSNQALQNNPNNFNPYQIDEQVGRRFQSIITNTEGSNQTHEWKVSETINENKKKKEAQSIIRFNRVFSDNDGWKHGNLFFTNNYLIASNAFENLASMKLDHSDINKHIIFYNKDHNSRPRKLSYWESGW